MIPSDPLAMLLAQTWQLAALIGGVLLVNRLLAKDRPHLAHALWLVVLLKCITPPLWSSPSGVFCWLQPRHAAVASVEYMDAGELLADSDVAAAFVPQASPGGVVVAMTPATFGVSSFAFAENAPAAFDWAGWLVWIWIGGAALSLGVAILRWGLFLRRLARYPRRDEPALTAYVEQLAKRLKVGRRVRLLITESRLGPAVIGLWRPTILLPAAIVAGKSPAELEPILAHELLHVRRSDLWLAAAQVLSQSLWWFHPLVWLANRLLTREAERCCDEQVLAELRCEPARYARSLLDILQHKHTLMTVPAFPGVRPVDVTSNRLERIMRLGQGCQRRTPWWCWIVMLLAAALALPGAAFVAAAKERPAKLKQPRKQTPAAVAPADDAGPAVTRAYQVRDLIPRVMEELKTDEDEAREDIRGHIIAFAGLKKPQLAWDGKKLVASHSEAEHQRIAEALELAREFGFRQVCITVRMISGPPELLERIPVQWAAAGHAPAAAKQPSTISATFDFEPLPLPAGVKAGEAWTQATTVVEKNVPVLYALLDTPQTRDVVVGAQNNPRTNILMAPKVTVFNGQAATVMDATQRPFVVGVKPVAGSQPAAYEPQIRVVSEGTTLRMRPVLKNAQNVHLDYEFTLASIRSVETAKIPQGPGHEPLTVQVPEVASIGFQSSLDLPLNKTLAVGALTTQGDKPAAMVVLLEVREIDLAAENAAAKSAITEGAILPTPQAVAPANYLKDDVQYFPPAPGREVSVGERLSRQIFASHGRMELDDAVASIAKAAGINIWLDPRGLAAEGCKVDMPITVQRQGKSLPAGTLLKQLLEPLGLEFRIENEGVRVTGVGEAQKMYTKVYHVADLVVAAPAIATGNGQPVSQPPAEAKADYAPLIELIKTTIAPQSWDEVGGPGSLSGFDTNLSLVVSQSQEVHAQVAVLLQHLRRVQKQQVMLGLQILVVPENFFERTGLELDVHSADSDTSFAHALLSLEQAAALGKAAGVRQTSDARLALLNGQARDIDLPVEGSQHKVSFKFLPRLLPDHQSVRLNVAVGEGQLAATSRGTLLGGEAGESLLLDVTDGVPVIGIPVLSKIPSVEKLFRQSPPAGSRVLLLVTPRLPDGPAPAGSTRATPVAR